jgi:hypothetical protein
MPHRSDEPGRILCTRRRALRWLAGGCGWALARQHGWAEEWPTHWQVKQLRFYADFPLLPNSPLVQDALDLQQSIPQVLTLNPHEEPIYLYLFSDEPTYHGYLKQYFPGVPYRRALYIKQQGPGMVFAYSNREIAIDVRHETTHAVLHALLPMVPLWLDEGLAEYFEVPASDRLYGNPHLKTVQRYVRWRRPAPLERLEAAERLDQMNRQEYREAWAWIHFLLHGPEPVTEEFRRYLADIHGHVPPGQLSRRLQQQIPDLARSYTEHFLKLAGLPS